MIIIYFRYLHENQTSVLSHSTLPQRYEFSADPSSPVLTIRNTEEGDGGEYTCRVQYYLTSPDYHVMDLVVIVLPDRPRIFLDNGDSVGDEVVIREGQYISLNCASSGGSPPLELLWWEHDEIIDYSFRK